MNTNHTIYRLAETLALEEHAGVHVFVNDWRKLLWVSRVNLELIQRDFGDPGTMERVRGMLVSE